MTRQPTEAELHAEFMRQHFPAYARPDGPQHPGKGIGQTDPAQAARMAESGPQAAERAKYREFCRRHFGFDPDDREAR